MSETKPAGGAERPAVCRYLRTKQMSPTVLDDQVLPWEAGENPEAAYHCLLTQGPVGPDDAIVHAVSCRSGRVCFRESLSR